MWWPLRLACLALAAGGALAQQGGEDCSTAAVLSGPLPINVSGATVGYANDYDEVCPYAGSRAPDVVYRFTPATPITVDVLLCDGWTDFDTKLYIYDSCPPALGQPVACNDDACTSAAGQGYVSALWNLPLTAGVTYYLVVDGYGDAAGAYELELRESLPAAECPPIGTVFGQRPDVEFWWLPFSDTGSTALGPRVQYESFFGLSERITGLHFWGGGLWWGAIPPDPAYCWRECHEDPQTFVITFYEDAGGRPGREACRYDVAVSPTLAGYVGYQQWEVYEYAATLDPPCALQRGWVSIVGGGAATCWFTWLSSSEGDGKSVTNPTPYGATSWPFDLSLCLLTDGGPAYGACCNDATGQCEENVALEDCAGRFTLGTCASFEPPCGQGRGACCADNGHCFLTSRGVCESGAGCRGDMNCDGHVDEYDINPFVLALANPAVYVQQYPHCFLDHGDTNGDGYVDFGDINPFIPLLGTDCGRTWLGEGTTCGECPALRIAIPAELPFVDNNATCGRGNSHDTTCLGSYDSGEDILYELVVTSGPVDIEITLDPKGTRYTGLLLTDVLPPGPNCIATSTGPDGSPHGTGCLRLETGTYYVMVDTWAEPACIERFELSIASCTPVAGRCCYGDPVECADVPAYACAALGGVWDPALTCATPCPGRAGEDCAHALPIAAVPFGVDLDNRGMTADGPAAPCDKYAPSGPMQRDAWFVWTSPADGLATVWVAGQSDPDHDLVLAVHESCYGPGARYCADHDDGVTGNEEQLIFAATMGRTYYFQVGDAGWHGGSTAPLRFELDLATGDGACCLPSGNCVQVSGAACWQQGGVYQGDGTACATVNCPPPTPGSTCADAVEVTLNAAGLPYVDSNSTTGRGNDYDETCLTRFDSGQDIVYRLTVTEPVSVRITLDPKGTRYTGFLLSKECPPTGDCVIVRRDTRGNPYSTAYNVLMPGVYYLMIDKWLLPADIPAFELRIESSPAPRGACCLGEQCLADMWREECHALGGNWFFGQTCSYSFTCPTQPGGTCANPFVVDSPWSFYHIYSTCGRGDAYNGNTCLAPYDGGEEMIYKLIIPPGEPARVKITLTDKERLRLALSDTCPPTGSCRFAGDGETLDVVLQPGEYYLMVDTWPYSWDPAYPGQWYEHCTSYQLSIQQVR